MLWWDDEKVKVYHGKALEELQKMENSFVNCCVTSPPYWGLRDYGAEGQIGLESSPQEYVDRLVEIFREVKRVLRDDGTLWLNLGDSYAANRSYQVTPTKWKSLDFGQSNAQKVPEGLKPKDLVGIPWMAAFALRSDGWYLRSDIIWAKPNPMPESVKDRCTRSHEYIFMLSKSAKYYYDSAAIAEESVSGDKRKPYGPGQVDSRGNGHDRGGGKLRKSDKQSEGSRTYAGFNDRWDTAEEEGLIGKTRNKRDVWFVAPKPFPEAHFATFPPKLIEPCILAGCPENGIVLDPFAGSGTTLSTALSLGRRSVGIELQENYLEMIRRRVTQQEISRYTE